MKYRTKLRIKYFLYGALSIIDLIAILFIGYLADRLIEMISLILGFFILRNYYEKQFHASTLIKCSIISLFIMGIICFMCIPKSYSVLMAIISSMLITYGSFMARDYLDLLDLKEIKKIKISKGIPKETLIKIIKNKPITETQINILIMYYCERQSITRIAHKLNYSYDYIVELKSKAIKEIAKGNVN